MNFRNATLSDASSLAAISAEVWLGTYIRNGVNRFFADYALEQFTTAKFETILRDAAERVIVSENRDGIDGFIRVTTGSAEPVGGASTTEITTLYIQPRHQGRGLGQGLLDKALAECRARGVASVWLAVNSENDAAIRFYRAFGFQPIGQTHFQIEDQSYLNEALLLPLGAPEF